MLPAAKVEKGEVITLTAAKGVTLPDAAAAAPPPWRLSKGNFRGIQKAATAAAAAYYFEISFPKGGGGGGGSRQAAARLSPPTDADPSERAGDAGGPSSSARHSFRSCLQSWFAAKKSGKK